MNILFLSPHFPPRYQYLCRALHREDAKVLGIGDHPSPYLPRTLKDSLTDYQYVPDMSDYEDVKSELARLITKHGPVAQIVSLNEHWLALEARLREDFDIPGLLPDALEKCRNKGAQRALFKELDIPHAKGALVNDLDELEVFQAALSTPVVLKPVLGSGAQGIVNLETGSDLTNMRRYLKFPAVVEECLKGELISCAGLVDKDGKVVFSLCSRMNKGLLDIVTELGAVHSLSLRQGHEALQEMVAKIIKGTKIRGNFFQIEAFRLWNKEYRVLEVNLRPPTGFSVDVMNYACDADFYSLWAKVFLGKELPETMPSPKYHVGHVGRRPHLRYRFSEQQLWDRFGRGFLLMDDIPAPFNRSVGERVILLRHSNLGEAEYLVKRVEEPR